MLAYSQVVALAPLALAYSQAVALAPLASAPLPQAALALVRAAHWQEHQRRRPASLAQPQARVQRQVVVLFQLAQAQALPLAQQLQVQR